MTIQYFMAEQNEQGIVCFVSLRGNKHFDGYIVKDNGTFSYIGNESGRIHVANADTLEDCKKRMQVLWGSPVRAYLTPPTGPTFQMINLNAKFKSLSALLCGIVLVAALRLYVGPLTAHGEILYFSSALMLVSFGSLLLYKRQFRIHQRAMVFKWGVLAQEEPYIAPPPKPRLQ